MSPRARRLGWVLLAAGCGGGGMPDRPASPGGPLPVTDTAPLPAPGPDAASIPGPAPAGDAGPPAPAPAPAAALGQIVVSAGDLDRQNTVVSFAMGPGSPRVLQQIGRASCRERGYGAGGAA